MKLCQQLIITVFLGLIFTSPVLGADLTIIAPYWGNQDYSYTNETLGMELTETLNTRGLFIQSINPDRYQWNLFWYQTNDGNTINGANFIFDAYFGTDPQHKKVIGIGLNYLEIELSKEGVPVMTGTLEAFNLKQQISSPYLRLGKYYLFEYNQLHCSLLPWIGGQWDRSQGSGTVDYPGPGSVSFSTDSDSSSWLSGLNCKIDLAHFLQLELKHSLAFQHDHRLNKSTAVINLFLSQNVGLSYRYNYHETTTGHDSYQLMGVAIMF